MSSSMAEIDPTNGSNINSTTSLYEDPQSQITDLILWERVHGIGLSILAIPANLVVIICLWRDPSSSVSGFSTYAVSVAITDLLVGVVLVPINVTRSYFSTWSPVSCVLWKLLDFGLTSVSMLLFLAMGYDRYRCVRAPLKYRSQFRTNRAMRVSLAVWIVGFLIWIPYLLMKHLPFDVEPFQTTCPNVIFRVKVFDILQVTVAYFIPLLALGAMNVILVRTLKRRPQIPRKQPSNSGYNLTNMSTISGIIELSTMPFEPLKTSPKHENQSPKTLRSRNTSSFKIILMVMRDWGFSRLPASFTVNVPVTQLN
ncbi:histamine H1 receptor-like [Liolophura sinensis]|uniref:histamine H1 receptor-like n=1 Tax=Liolophura sinensis TaxID=3198878 RepID=UPI0031596CD2